MTKKLISGCSHNTIRNSSWGSSSPPATGNTIGNSNCNTKSEPFALVPIRVLQDSRLGLRDIKVLVALLRYRSKEGYAWPSIVTLSSDTGIDERHIQRTIRHLQSLNYLQDFGYVGKTRKWLVTIGYQKGNCKKNPDFLETDRVAVSSTAEGGRFSPPNIPNPEQTKKTPTPEPVTPSVSVGGGLPAESKTKPNHQKAASDVPETLSVTFPTSIPVELKKPLTGLLKGLNRAQSEAVLFELAFRIQNGEVLNPVAYGATLTRKMRDGSFFSQAIENNNVSTKHNEIIEKIQQWKAHQSRELTISEMELTAIETTITDFYAATGRPDAYHWRSFV